MTQYGDNKCLDCKHNRKCYMRSRNCHECGVEFVCKLEEEIEETLELNGVEHNTYLPKKIMEAFKGIDYELSVCSDELPKILNYITTLQEKNEELEKNHDFRVDQVHNLQKK